MDFFLKIQEKKKRKIHEEDDDFSKEKILRLQYDIIDKWKDTSETFYLTKGPPNLGILGALSGIFVHNHYRKKLKLGTYGRATSYLPIVVLPAIVAPMVHKMVFQAKILLGEYKCSLCVQMKAGLTQAALAVVYPGVLAPFASFMYATRHFTYRLPSITQNPREVFTLWSKLSKPIVKPVIGLLLANYFAAQFLTYKELKDFHSIMTKLDQRTTALEAL
ncbi:uncharacterized protein DMENIID0001_145930 [Sergentomyia squamirostris]